MSVTQRLLKFLHNSYRAPPADQFQQYVCPIPHRYPESANVIPDALSRYRNRQPEQCPPAPIIIDVDDSPTCPIVIDLVDEDDPTSDDEIPFSGDDTTTSGGSTESSNGDTTSFDDDTTPKPDVIFVESKRGLTITKVEDEQVDETEPRRSARVKEQARRKLNQELEQQQLWTIPTTHDWFLNVQHLRQCGGSPPWIYIGKSEIHKNGVFTNSIIKKGSIIMEYLGEIIDEDEQERREAAGHCGTFAKYIDGCVIDGANKGKYINHSCEPNSALELLVFEDGTASVVMTALEDIAPGEELTCDYKYEDEGPDNQIVCTCKTSKCRQIINISNGN